MLIHYAGVSLGTSEVCNAWLSAYAGSRITSDPGQRCQHSSQHGDFLQVGCLLARPAAVDRTRLCHAAARCASAAGDWFMTICCMTLGIGLEVCVGCTRSCTRDADIPIFFIVMHADAISRCAQMSRTQKYIADRRSEYSHHVNRQTLLCRITSHSRADVSVCTGDSGFT